MTRSGRVVLSVVALALVAAVSQASAAGRVEAGTVKGIATTALRQPLAGYLLRLRSLENARLVRVIRTDAAGAYEFTNVDPGIYYLEVLDSANKIISTDGPIVVSKSSEQKHTLRTTLIVAAALPATAVAIGSLRDGRMNARPAPTTFQPTAAEVVDAAAVAGIKDGMTQGERILPSAPD